MRFTCLFFAALLVSSIPVIVNAQGVDSTAAIASNSDDIYNNPLSPVAGNPNGDVTIVEFYDYRCGFCKAAQEGLERIVQEDGNLKVIYKDFPKLGPLSVTTAIITLASIRQGTDKYLQLHNILMRSDTHISGEDAVYQTAASVGIDVKQLKKDVKDATFARQIHDNMTLGRGIGVRVTPSFIVGGHFYPGFATYDQLKKIVDYERTTDPGK